MYGFIVNKVSGNGRGGRVWKQVEKALQQKEIDYTVCYTERPRHASSLTAELLKADKKMIVVIGGDGTLNEVCGKLAYEAVPLGVIPAGSGNDFARSLGVPVNPLKALERVLASQVKQVDLLNLGKRCCLTVAGTGFDGEVARTVNKAAYKRYFNNLRLAGLSYALSVVETLRAYEPTTVRIRVDGKERLFQDAWLVAVANAPAYGGGITICPDAVFNDGLLNVCIVHGLKKWEMLKMFPKTYKGNHVKTSAVTLMQGKEVHIQSDPPVPVQADGEPFMESPVYISVEKGALNVV